VLKNEREAGKNSLSTFMLRFLKKMPHDDDINSDEHLHNGARLNARKKNIKKEDLKAIIEFILMHSSMVKKNDCTVLEPAPGSLTRAAKIYGMTPQNVSRIWMKAKANKANPAINCYYVTPRKGGSKYGNPKWDIEALKEEMRNLPYDKRSTFRSMSKMLVVPTSTLSSIFHSGGAIRRNKQGSVKRNSSVIAAVDKNIT
jgi:hypothetical protein